MELRVVSLGTKRTRSVAAPVGNGKELLMVAAGALVFFVLCLAFCPCLRRLGRRLLRLIGIKTNKGARHNKWNRNRARYHGPGHH